jgi:hypothetical protein
MVECSGGGSDLRHRLSRRELDEIDRELEDPETRQAVEGAWSGRREPASIIGYRTPTDLGLLAKAAQQDVQLSNMQDEIESLKGQRRWLLGGLGVSVAAFLLVVIRRRPRPTQGLAAFYRCAECGEDRSEIAAVGAYVQLGNELMGVICCEPCQPLFRGKLLALMAYAFPELDADGFALDTSAAAPFAPIDSDGPPAAGAAPPSEACGSPSDRAALSSGGAQRPVPPEASAPEGRENQESAS